MGDGVEVVAWAVGASGRGRGVAWVGGGGWVSIGRRLWRGRGEGRGIGVDC